MKYVFLLLSFVLFVLSVLSVFVLSDDFQKQSAVYILGNTFFVGYAVLSKLDDIVKLLQELKEKI